MPTTRPGCSFCFKGQPAGGAATAAAWCACEQCGRLYHAGCWELSKPCFACGCARSAPAAPPRAAPRRPERRRAIPVTPAGVVYVPKEGPDPRFADPTPRARRRREGLRQLRALLPALHSLAVALILVGLAAGIGAYVFRLATLPAYSPGRVMDALFRQRPPEPAVVVGAALAGLIAAWAAYPRATASAPAQRGTRILGGLVALCLLNALLVFTSGGLRLAPLALPGYAAELLVAQGASILGVALLTPIFRGSAPSRGAPLTAGLPEWARRLLLWARFAIVALGITSLVALLVIAGAMSALSLPGGAVGPATLGREPLRTLLLSSLAVGVGASAIFFWPPRFRNLPALPLLRLVVVAGSLLVVGLLYRSAPDSEALLATASAVGAVMFCTIPLQRSLS